MPASKALTCWVHSNEVAYSWFESMLGMTRYAIEHDSAAHGGYLPIRFGSGGLVEARNKAVDAFLNTDCDWLFWIDTDMGFSPSTLDDLVAAAHPETAPVVGALCFINHETGRDGMGGLLTSPKPTVFRWARNPDGKTGFVPDRDYPRDEKIRCDGTGSACILIHRTVLEKIRDLNGGNYYGHIVNPEDPMSPFSEDLSFCLRLAELEIPLHVHTGIRATHLKPVWLSEEHMDAWPAVAVEGAV